MSSLKNNPFYILGIPVSSTRSEIIEAVEEKSFFIDEKVCDEAQSALLNSPKRLAAEIDWFLEKEEGLINRINRAIEQNVIIDTDGLGQLSQLNASLHNLSLSLEEDYFEIGYAILDIDDLFEAINRDNLLATINTNRRAAKVAEVSSADIARELGRKRESIRQVITERLYSLNEEEYIDLTTMIADKCLAQNDYNDGVVLSDVVDQYEIRMQREIENKTEAIEDFIKAIKENGSDSLSERIDCLIEMTRNWDIFVQPLQLKSMASGMPHQISERIGHSIRDLSLYLNNELNKPEESLKITVAMQGIFSEIVKLTDTLKSDVDALNTIVGANSIESYFASDFAEIDDWVKELKSYATSNDISIFNEKVTNLNAKIYGFNADLNARNDARKVLCYKARDLAVFLNNEKKRSDFAARIASILKTNFSDIPELQEMLSKDAAALNAPVVTNNTVGQQKAKKTAWVWLIVVAIMLGLLCCNGGSGSSAITDTDVKYSRSAEVGESVYADIVSIFPTYGIYEEGTSYYHSFVCEAETSNGSKVWVYLTVNEYKSNFDSSATNDFDDEAEWAYFSAAQRIYGTVQSADSIVYNLSDDIKSETVINFYSR